MQKDGYDFRGKLRIFKAIFRLPTYHYHVKRLRSFKSLVGLLSAHNF